jgi:hypothetical protein
MPQLNFAPHHYGLHVSIRQVGEHFRVVYQRQYPNAVEEVIYTERFATTEGAQKFVDAGLRAQRIYRSLTSRSDRPSIVKRHRG